MRGRAERNEAAPYYFTYIDRIASDNIVNKMDTQMEETLTCLRGISEEKSLHKYAPEKWTIREGLGRTFAAGSGQLLTANKMKAFSLQLAV